MMIPQKGTTQKLESKLKTVVLLQDGDAGRALNPTLPQTTTFSPHTEQFLVKRSRN